MYECRHAEGSVQEYCAGLYRRHNFMSCHLGGKYTPSAANQLSPALLPQTSVCPAIGRLYFLLCEARYTPVCKCFRWTCAAPQELATAGKFANVQNFDVSYLAVLHPGRR